MCFDGGSREVETQGFESPQHQQNPALEHDAEQCKELSDQFDENAPLLMNLAVTAESRIVVSFTISRIILLQWLSRAMKYLPTDHVALLPWMTNACSALVRQALASTYTPNGS